MINNIERQHLRRCVELASEALAAGDEPFGSVLVDETGTVLAEERNQVGKGDRTQHPEFAIARWAANNMTPQQRAAATVFTSGEHCPMCAAAHGWVGLGRIVYASSSAQRAKWLTEFGATPPPIRILPIQDIVPDIEIEGPVDDFAEQLKDLHRQSFNALSSKQ